jgi:regulator of sigma E protease
MLGGVTVNFILAFIIYIGMAFAYGDTYVANDFKDVYLKIPCKSGFQNGDKIWLLPMGTIVKFDNDIINMKVIMAKKS